MFQLIELYNYTFEVNLLSCISAQTAHRAATRRSSGAPCDQTGHQAPLAAHLAHLAAQLAHLLALWAIRRTWLPLGDHLAHQSNKRRTTRL